MPATGAPPTSLSLRKRGNTCGREGERRVCHVSTIRCATSSASFARKIRSKMLILKRSANSSAKRFPRTLFPLPSSRGDLTHSPTTPGTTRKIAPLAPLLAGIPTVQAHSPLALYIPQLLVTCSVSLTVSKLSTLVAVSGDVPYAAKVPAMLANICVFTRRLQYVRYKSTKFSICLWVMGRRKAPSAAMKFATAAFQYDISFSARMISMMASVCPPPERRWKKSSMPFARSSVVSSSSHLTEHVTMHPALHSALKGFPSSFVEKSVTDRPLGSRPTYLCSSSAPYFSSVWAYTKGQLQACALNS
eukprot:Sspe_Gene.98700::Locus_72104_Transcript_1_1_Confidence_1.000_Length_2447::g.98700::m.98700